MTTANAQGATVEADRRTPAHQPSQHQSGLGYPVTAVANPLRGLLSDAAYVRARLESISGPIILVGHSYGGAVITNAAVGVTNVKALVYVGAFSPGHGESVATVLPPDQYPGSHLDGTKRDVVPVANPVAPGGQDVDRVQVRVPRPRPGGGSRTVRRRGPQVQPR